MIHSRSLLVSGFAAIGIAILVVRAMSGSGLADRAPAPVYFLGPRASLEVAGDPLDGAKPVASLSDISASDLPALIIIDASAVDGADPAEVSALALAGSAIGGLNVPLDTLNALASFDAAIGEINEEFEQHSNTNAIAFDGPFLSLIWRSPPGAQPARWGRAQRELSDLTFAAVYDKYRLKARGLMRESDGTIIPLEAYGQ